LNLFPSEKKFSNKDAFTIQPIIPKSHFVSKWFFYL
jgi:hypothetical protein